jgi:hypothetical protein
VRAYQRLNPLAPFFALQIVCFSIWVAFPFSCSLNGQDAPLTTDSSNISRAPVSAALEPMTFSQLNNGDAIGAMPDLHNLQFAETDGTSSGINFNEFPRNYLSGLTLRNGRWGVKLGGFVKADLIHDLRAIDSTDTFDPSTIPIGEPQRTNTRFHTRQTRLNMDARWIADSGDPLRILVEGDFFGAGDTLRLRHAYGEYNGVIIGQTWSTLTHRAALPNTLDLVGDVASVGRRQSQVRWTKDWMEKRWAVSAALEDSQTRVDKDLLTLGEPRAMTPDAIARLRFTNDDLQLQIAGVARRLGFQPTGSEVLPFSGGGINATGFVDITKVNRIYGGILWGNGIGNYRDLPDLGLTSPTTGTSLESLSWYTGLTHEWSKRWTTNVTYSQGDIKNTPFQPAESVSRLQYLAANLIWQPTQYTFAGTEYLWGMRRNHDGLDSDASRVMVSFGFLLP